MKFRDVTDFYFAHRLHIAAVMLMSGSVLAGIPIPLPTGGTFHIAVEFPSLILTGKILAGFGAMAGGVGVLSKWFHLAPSQAEQLAAAAKTALRENRTILVQTPAGQQNIRVTPVDES